MTATAYLPAGGSGPRVIDSAEPSEADLPTSGALAKLPSPSASRYRLRSRSGSGAPGSTLVKRVESSCAPGGTVTGYSCVPGSLPLGSALPVVAEIRLPACTSGVARPQPTPDSVPLKLVPTGMSCWPDAVAVAIVTLGGAPTGTGLTEIGTRSTRLALVSTSDPNAYWFSGAVVT